MMLLSLWSAIKMLLADFLLFSYSSLRLICSAEEEFELTKALFILKFEFVRADVIPCNGVRLLRI